MASRDAQRQIKESLGPAIHQSHSIETSGKDHAAVCGALLKMPISWFSREILLPRRLGRGVQRDSSCPTGESALTFRAGRTAMVALLAIPRDCCSFHFVLPSLFV